MNPKQEAIIKNKIMMVLAPIGLALYFYDGGTFLKALVWLLIFNFIKVSAMIAYHRWLAHSHFKPNLLLKSWLLYSMICGVLVKPFYYVIGHRAHHRYPDTDNDPHTPTIGFWNAFIGKYNDIQVTVKVSDVLRMPEIAFINKYFYGLYIVNLVAWWFIDYQVVLLSFAFLNVMQLYSATAFNYFAHGGKKTLAPVNMPWYNSYLLALFGEHLHKNHHDDPSNPDMSLGKEPWYNTDISYKVLKCVAQTRKV